MEPLGPSGGTSGERPGNALRASPGLPLESIFAQVVPEKASQSCLWNSGNFPAVLRVLLIHKRPKAQRLGRLWARKPNSNIQRFAKPPQACSENEHLQGDRRQTCTRSRLIPKFVCTLCVCVCVCARCLVGATRMLFCTCCLWYHQW